MINAPYEKEFVFHDGQRAKNLLELSVIIERLNQQDFERFVNPSKNDFANWIEYVLLDAQLASSLRSTILLNKTIELLNNKLAVENNSASSMNTAGDALQKRKPLFNIFKQEQKTPILVTSTPIQRLPEPEHHIIEKLPEKLPEKNPEKISGDKQKRKWFSKKELQERSEQKDAVPKKDDSAPKKDNALKKWYEFKKRMSAEPKEHNISESPEDSHPGNILWTLIYGTLIVVIIALIIYKFVLYN